MSRILIVEDDEMVQSIYQAILTKEGYKVEVASDGQEALRKASAKEPDLILLDMLMPSMSGLEFLRAYDLRNQHPHVKVIAFSNADQPELIRDAAALGAIRYMTKFSFSPKAMVGLIQDALASKGHA